MNPKQLDEIKQQLDQNTAHLDAATLSRLRQAREQALATLDKKSWFMQPLPVVFASMCVAILGALLLINGEVVEPINDEQPQIVNIILLDDSVGNALVTEETDVEFYEDIEFYQWLEQSQQINAG